MRDDERVDLSRNEVSQHGFPREAFSRTDRRRKDHQLMLTYIVTFKLRNNPNHDPLCKRTDKCVEVNGLDALCTDSTGAHHSVAVTAESLDHALRAVDALMRQDLPYSYVRVTRVEHCRTLNADDHAPRRQHYAFSQAG